MFDSKDAFSIIIPNYFTLFLVTKVFEQQLFFVGACNIYKLYLISMIYIAEIVSLKVWAIFA